MIPRGRTAVLAGLALVIAAVGCTSKPTVRVGMKSFAEQRVLGEVLRQLIEAKTDLAASVFECGDAFACQRAIRGGEIDLFVEYTGTGFLYSGSSTNGPISLEVLRELYKPMGLQWRHLLGFDNSYVVAMSARRAANTGFQTIADLARIDGGNIRVAVPPTYLRRPRDGLASLLQRHGLRLRGDPIAIDEPSERLDAVRRGRADVAVVYATDGALRGADFTLLEDSLRFYPPYDAALLIRSDLLSRHPDLGEALSVLEGKFDNASIQELNYGIEVEGWTPAVLAGRFLRKSELVGHSVGKSKRVPRISIAIAASDRLGDQQTRATRAAKVVFSDRPVSVVEVPDPVEAVASGQARLALLGAERFFVAGEAGVQRESRVQAAAVVGRRIVHLIRRPGDTSEPLSGRLGIGPHGSGRAMVASAILRTAGLRVSERAPDRTLIEHVASGALDAALILTSTGDEHLAEVLGRGTVVLVPLPPLNRRDQLPFLRASRIPRLTYPGQETEVDSLGAQVVLAGPSPPISPIESGPVGAVGRAVQPLTVEETRALSRATGILEIPDPVLPSTLTAFTKSPRAEDDSGATIVETALNMLVLAFLAWLALLVTRREPMRPGR